MNNERDYWTVQAMREYGGSFVQSLAELAERADPINLEKIKETWPEYWQQYELEGKKMQTKKP